MHRAKLQRSLLRGCEQSSAIELSLSTSLVDIDFAQTRIMTKPTSRMDDEPTWHEADVIIAADGIKRISRSLIPTKEGGVDAGEADPDPFAPLHCFS